jgi:hypothetical protein
VTRMRQQARVETADVSRAVDKDSHVVDECKILAW